MHVLHRRCHIHFCICDLPVSCYPGRCFSMGLWSNSYFYHKLEILFQGIFHFGKGSLLAIRGLCREYQRWEDCRQKPWVVLPYLLWCLSLSPPVICANSPPQPHQHPHSLTKREHPHSLTRSPNCSKNKILVPQGQPAFYSLNPSPHHISWDNFQGWLFWFGFFFFSIFWWFSPSGRV